MPFLSIIIPVYKVEPYLRECLDSVAASPLDCWEAILINDGSPDGCPQICDDYATKDKRFRVIHQENAGVAAARNAGLDVAQGEWCWFVDSDDVVDMQPVGAIIEWLSLSPALPRREGDNGEVDLVMFDLETFNENEGGLPFTVYGLHGGENEKINVPVDVSGNKNDFLMKHVCYHHQRLWYRRSQLRFTRGIKTGEDGEFMYKYYMICRHPIRVLSTIYYYRIRLGSASNNENSRAQVVKDTIQVLYNLLSYMKEQQISLEPWLTIRLQSTMKILLYSIYKSKQFHNKDLQHTLRDICKQYNDAGYNAFDGLLLRIARYSIPYYCFLLKINMCLKN